MSVKAILFDKDGTLIDFDATWGKATYEVLNVLAGGNAQTLALLAEVSVYDLETKVIHHTSPIVGDSPKELALLWAEIAGREAGEDFEHELDRLFTRESLKQLSGFTTTEPALSQLFQEGYRLGIATNDAEETAVLHIEKLGWSHYFEVTYGYNSGHGPKPGPGMVQAFGKHLGLETSQIVMIGDSLHDMEAGRSGGAHTIGVRTGPWGGRHLAGYADAVIDSLADLPQILKQPPFALENQEDRNQ